MRNMEAKISPLLYGLYMETNGFPGNGHHIAMGCTGKPSPLSPHFQVCPAKLTAWQSSKEHRLPGSKDKMTKYTHQTLPSNFTNKSKSLFPCRRTGALVTWSHMTGNIWPWDIKSIALTNNCFSCPNVPCFFHVPDLVMLSLYVEIRGSENIVLDEHMLGYKKYLDLLVILI